MKVTVEVAPVPSAAGATGSAVRFGNDSAGGGVGRPVPIVPVAGRAPGAAIVQVNSPLPAASALHVQSTIGPRPAPEATILPSESAIVTVQGLSPRSAEPGSEGAVTARLGLGHVLRAVARDRAEVVVAGTDGSRWTGRIERVGADHLELAAHDPGEPSRVRAVQYIAFAGLASLRAAAYG